MMASSEMDSKPEAHDTKQVRPLEHNYAWKYVYICPSVKFLFQFLLLLTDI